MQRKFFQVCLISWWSPNVSRAGIISTLNLPAPIKSAPNHTSNWYLPLQLPMPDLFHLIPPLQCPSSQFVATTYSCSHSHSLLLPSFCPHQLTLHFLPIWPTPTHKLNSDVIKFCWSNASIAMLHPSHHDSHGVSCFHLYNVGPLRMPPVNVLGEGGYSIFGHVIDFGVEAHCFVETGQIEQNIQALL